MNNDLARAIRNDDARTVAEWLDRGGHPDSVDATGESCLSAASRSGARSVVALLLSRGASPDLFAVWPSPLVLASEAGHLAIVQQLLDAGADIGSEPWHEDADLPLLSAVAAGNWEIARILLDAGAVEKADPRWLPDIFESALAGKGKLRTAVMGETVARLLVRFGEAPLPVDDRLLKKAAALLRKSADHATVAGELASRVDERKAFEEEIVELYAEEQRFDNALSKLRSAPPMERGHAASTLLGYAILEQRWDDVDEILSLAKDADRPDVNGVTPIMRAVWNGASLPFVSALLARGAALRRADAHGQSVLDWAELGRKREVIDHIVHLLHESAAAVDARDDARLTRLEGDAVSAEASRLAVEAASERRWERAESLLARGGDVGGPGRGGRTLLMCAAAQADHARFLDLLRRGADLHAKDAHGQDVSAYTRIADDSDATFNFVMERLIARYPDIEADLDGFAPCVAKLTRVNVFGFLLWGVPDSWPSAGRGELRLRLRGEEKFRAEVEVGVRCPNEILLTVRPALTDEGAAELRTLFAVPE